ncbi:MAG: NfeD family protein [Phycisphaerae bacterium]
MIPLPATHVASSRRTLFWLARMLVLVACVLSLSIPAFVPLPAHADAQSPSAPPSTAATAPASPLTNPAAMAVPAHRKAANVAIITLKGEIDGGGRFGSSVMATSVQRRIATATRAGADAIIFEIDSPGGELNATLKIAQLIKDSPVPNTIAWVRPRAMSGGAIVALAARELITSDPATFGDAMPIQGGPGGVSAVPRELLPKILPPLITEIKDSARRHNDFAGGYIRDEYLLQAIVATDLELWWVKNTQTGQTIAIDRSEFAMLFPGADTGGPTRLAAVPAAAADRTLPIAPNNTSATAPAPGEVPAGSQQLAAIAPDVAASATLPPTQRPQLSEADRGKWTLVDKITDGTGPATFSALDLAHYNIAANAFRGVDGKVVVQPIKTDDDLKAFMGAQNLRRLDSSWSEGLVLMLTHPIARGVLIAVFLIALFAEMSHPGAVLPGVISLLALVALLAPPLIIGMASWWEVLAIIIGIILLAVEIFIIPGFGIPGVLGLALLFLGLLGTFIPAGAGLFPTSGKGSSELVWGMGIILSAFITTGFALYFLAKHFGSLPIMNKLVLNSNTDVDVATFATTTELDAPATVGEQGITITPMHPAGRVELESANGAPGRVIDAVSEFGFLEPGAKVKVVNVDGIRVSVERIA